MGKHKYIETPEKMWELFEAYKKATKDNPIIVQTPIGTRHTPILDIEKERPLTFEGFENYVASLDGMPQGLDQYFSNQDKLYNDYMGVCSRIRRVIRQDQIEGGLGGIYNPSITQRLNGLTDKSEVKVQAEQPLFGKE